MGSSPFTRTKACLADGQALSFRDEGTPSFNPPPLRGCPQGQGERIPPQRFALPPSVGLTASGPVAGGQVSVGEPAKHISPFELKGVRVLFLLIASRITASGRDRILGWGPGPSIVPLRACIAIYVGQVPHAKSDLAQISFGFQPWRLKYLFAKSIDCSKIFKNGQISVNNPAQ